MAWVLHLSRLLVNRIEPSKRTCDQASHLQLSGPRRLAAGQAGYVVTTIAQATRLTIQRSSRSLRTFNCEASHCFFRPSPPKDERGPEALHPHPSWRGLAEGGCRAGVSRCNPPCNLTGWACKQWPTTPDSRFKSRICGLHCPAMGPPTPTGNQLGPHTPSGRNCTRENYEQRCCKHFLSRIALQ